MNACNTFRNVVVLFFNIVLLWPILYPAMTLILWPVLFFSEGADCNEGRKDANRFVKWLWTGDL